MIIYYLRHLYLYNYLIVVRKGTPFKFLSNLYVACMYGCIYVCMHVCMYVCVYV